MKFYLILTLTLFIVSCSVFTNKPKLYSHKNRVMTLCCQDSNTRSCSDEQWATQAKKHCPSGFTQINQDKREQIKYTGLPPSGLYEQHVYNYDTESSIQKNNEFILKKQTLNCINYQCNGPIHP